MMSEERISKVKYLISHFNFTRGRRYQFSTISTQEAVSKALDACGDDIFELKEYVSKWTNDDIIECFNSFAYSKSKEKEQAQEQVTEVSQQEKVENSSNSNQMINNYMGLLENALAKVIVETQGEKIAESIISSISGKVDDYIKETYGIIEKKIKVSVGDKPAVPMTGILHDKFETVLKFVANNEPVFLTGPAGSGKNVLCKQVADALGLNFYFTNAVTQEYKITGFTDAMGVYHETQFYKAFKNGGLFMLDEMDASIPEVLVILNSAIANKYFDFPAPIGYVEALPDFRVISAGNTFCLGADYEYVGRNQLDMASLDRFALVRIDYSHNIELAVTNNNEELVDFVDDFRKACGKAGVQTVVSYRGLQRLAKMEELLGVQEALITCLTKNLGKDEIRNILANIKVNNKYKKELENI